MARFSAFVPLLLCLLVPNSATSAQTVKRPRSMVFASRMWSRVPASPSSSTKEQLGRCWTQPAIRPLRRYAMAQAGNPRFQTRRPHRFFIGC